MATIPKWTIRRIPSKLDSSSALLAVLVALLLVFIVVIRHRARASRRPRTIVLAGPCGSGKTALFTKENEGVVSARWDQTAMEVNEKRSSEDSWPPRSIALQRPLLVIDTPGHARLRARILSRAIPGAAGIVLTLDALTGLTSTQIRHAGDHLQLVLALTPTATPLLILLTRADAIPQDSWPSTLTRARTALEREMERRRTAIVASSSLGGGARLDALPSGDGKATSASAPVEDEAEILAAATADLFEGVTAPWTLAAVAPGPVHWAMASSRGGLANGLDSLWAWLDQA